MSALLEVKDLSVDFMTVRGIVHAVQGVSFTLEKGEVHGVVGESGCGKSVSTKAIMRLNEGDKVQYDGNILFDGGQGTEDILTFSRKRMQQLRGNDISMIFQDPMTSLNPIMRCGEQVAEVVRKKRKLPKAEARASVLSIFEQIGILPAEKRYDQYPFEMSGGMLQRVMIAMALSLKPKIMIADEPTTALDVTIQAQILDLLVKLKQQFKMTIRITRSNRRRRVFRPDREIGHCRETRDGKPVPYGCKSDFSLR